VAREAKLRVKNAHLLLTLEAMDHGVSATHFQRGTVPPAYRARVSAVFDGIDTEAVRPDPAASFTLGARTFRAGGEIITFVNRNLEPYRGYHVFMRALPEILRRRPNAVALIVGGDQVSYGAAPRVQEVIEPRKNRLLVDFFDTAALAATVADGLARPGAFAHLRAAARQTAVERFDLATVCLPQQVRLVDRLANS
jgi:glycosyltransferase involved in cell wall biosynthesis